MQTSIKTPRILVLGADNAGADLKNQIADLLRANDRIEVRDMGVRDAHDSTAYPDIGVTVADEVANGSAWRGILVCGTGIGMAISANKVPGIRATVAHDSYSVERSIRSNNCQILTLGARVIGPELAIRLVREWLSYEFDDASPSAAKVARLTELEDAHRRRAAS